ncbi:hypothetical protein EYS14_07510 [Alteromonadaceae bacterium M269]|nr:hypothetical protein EYS14_07510 [Alteromonadaceae bacterium M269]
MFIEIIRAILFAGIPIFVVSYFMINRAIQSKQLDRFNDSDGLDSAMKVMVKQYKENKKKKVKQDTNPVMAKWMYFGGGFYGLMALITYLYIEAKEIFEFVVKLFKLSWDQVWSHIGFDLLVDLLVEAIQNLISAFVWFHYWADEITMKNGWYWLGAAYIGYMLGAKLAEQFPVQNTRRFFLKS